MFRFKSFTSCVVALIVLIASIHIDSCEASAQGAIGTLCHDFSIRENGDVEVTITIEPVVSSGYLEYFSTPLVGPGDEEILGNVQVEIDRGTGSGFVNLNEFTLVSGSSFIGFTFATISVNIASGESAVLKIDYVLTNFLCQKSVFELRLLSKFLNYWGDSLESDVEAEVTVILPSGDTFFSTPSFVPGSSLGEVVTVDTFNLKYKPIDIDRCEAFIFDWESNTTLVLAPSAGICPDPLITTVGDECVSTEPQDVILIRMAVILVVTIAVLMIIVSFVNYFFKRNETEAALSNLTSYPGSNDIVLAPTDLEDSITVQAVIDEAEDAGLDSIMPVTSIEVDIRDIYTPPENENGVETNESEANNTAADETEKNETLEVANVG